MKGVYGALNFTGETRAGPFWWQILRGRKVQTIREPRKDKRPHVRVGELVKLFWKMRIPEKEKPIHLIAYAKALSYEKIRRLDYWYDEENAKDDGFEDLEEFRLWFLPDWPEFSDVDREAIRIAHNLDREIGETILTSGEGRGSRLFRAVKELSEPMMRIVFEIRFPAKPTCPHCKKFDPVLDEEFVLDPVGSEYTGLARCGQCNQTSEITAFNWSRPQLPNILFDEKSKRSVLINSLKK